MSFDKCKINDFDDEATRWQCISIYLYICIRMFDHGYDVDFHLTVMLRSTTGPYGRPVIEVAYGEMIYSLHRGCM